MKGNKKANQKQESPDPYFPYLLDCGFYFVGSLREIRANPDLPKDLKRQGIYAVVSKKSYTPRYIDSNTIQRSNNVRGEILPQEQLQNRWVSGTRVLYIGQSGKSIGEKLRKLVMHMQGYTTTRGPHIDGETLFHLKDHQYFMVYVLPIQRPKEVQSFLIREFKEEFESVPFANSMK